MEEDDIGIRMKVYEDEDGGLLLPYSEVWDLINRKITEVNEIAEEFKDPSHAAICYKLLGHLRDQLREIKKGFDQSKDNLLN